jgi:hypothetical protein
MNIGMLWYDDDTKRPLSEKVARAVDYYKAKYGSVPTVCFVNPATLKDSPDTAAGVQIRPARNVMVDHFWLGVGESDGDGGANGKGRANGKASANARAAGAPARSNGRGAGRARAHAAAGRAG